MPAAGKNSGRHDDRRAGSRRDHLDRILAQVPRGGRNGHGAGRRLLLRGAVGGWGVAFRGEPAPRGFMSAVVEFRGIAYSVPRDAGRFGILEDLTFTVDAGETLVLLGRSGSGKTTALRMVNRLIMPTAGEVLVEGKPTSAWDPIRLRRSIGYVIQETGLFPHFTVAENIGLVPRLEGW